MSAIENTSPKILRLNDVKIQTGLSRSAIYALAKLDQFPKPINLSLRSVGWLENEINDWIKERISLRVKA